MNTISVKLSQLVLQDLSLCIQEIKNSDAGSQQQKWPLTRFLFLHSMLPVICFMEECGEPVGPGDVLALPGLQGILHRMEQKHGQSFAMISPPLKNAIALIPGYAPVSATQPLETAEFYAEIASQMRHLNLAAR